MRRRSHRLGRDQVREMNLCRRGGRGTLGRVRTYGQYCPIARGAEIFATRWTPIIVRNLLLGCRTYGELADGAPGLSRALLSQRLRQLEAHGIVRRSPNPAGRGWLY